jgi:hypothetical protein
MEKNDYLFVAGALLTAVLAGGWAHLMNLSPAVDGMIDFFTAAAVLVGLAFVYLARDSLGGESARNLEVLGTGLLVFVVSYWPSYVWSTAGNPGWLGMTQAFWSMLFGMLNLAGFTIVAYGFYRFWNMGK